MIKKWIFPLLPFFLFGCAVNQGEAMKDTYKFTRFTSKYPLCTVKWLKMVDSNNLVLGIDMTKLNDSDPAMAWLTRFCGTTALYLSNSSGGESMTVWAVPSTNKSNDMKDGCFFRIKGIWKGTDMRLKLEKTTTNIYDLCAIMKRTYDECYRSRIRKR